MGSTPTRLRQFDFGLGIFDFGLTRVCRAKSTADILNKILIVEEEADESMFWIELLIESDIVAERKLSSLYKDLDGIVAMTVASIKTLRLRKEANPKSKIGNPQ